MSNTSPQNRMEKLSEPFAPTFTPNPPQVMDPRLSPESTLRRTPDPSAAKTAQEREQRRRP